MSCTYRKVVQRPKVIQIAFCLAFTWLSTSALAQYDTELESINSTYQTLLNDYLRPSQKNGLQVNLMDYGQVRHDPRFKQLLEMLESYPQERLDTKAKKLAFYLNAYNILAINKVAENWPLFNLRSLGTFYKPVWTHPAGTVCKEKMTLRMLEHEILRRLDEPRVHMALNCASVSCPDLRPEPYVVDKLEQQLEDQTRAFLNQQGKGATIKGNKLQLSAIFEWFAEDFDSEGGVEQFVGRYLKSPADQWEIDGYFPYDWDVNDHLNGSEKHKINRRASTWF